MTSRAAWNSCSNRIVVPRPRASALAAGEDDRLFAADQKVGHIGAFLHRIRAVRDDHAGTIVLGKPKGDAAAQAENIVEGQGEAADGHELVDLDGNSVQRIVQHCLQLPAGHLRRHVAACIVRAGSDRAAGGDQPDFFHGSARFDEQAKIIYGLTVMSIGNGSLTNMTKIQWIFV